MCSGSSRPGHERFDEHARGAGGIDAVSCRGGRRTIMRDREHFEICRRSA